MLRLANTVVGPAEVATGANGAPQTLEAFNAGDGSLKLTLSVPASVSWLGATVGAPRSCTQTTAAATCVPLQFALNTAALAAGTYTAIVTVNGDPSTVDAPQTIAVTVQVGGGVPASATALVKPGCAAASFPGDANQDPGCSADIAFTTNSQGAFTATTKDGNPWLSLVLDGLGSFRFVFPYRIHIQPPAGMAAGSYSGTITAKSAFAADNKSIPVTMQITTQPIAQASVDRLQVQLAQGAPAFATTIGLTNIGLGSMAAGSVSASGGAWLTAAQTACPAVLVSPSLAAAAGCVAVTLDAGSLAPGSNIGSMVINSNAANGPVTIPVELDVVAKGAPAILFQGVQDNATFVPGGAVSPGGVAAVKGEQFFFASPLSGPAPPLGTQIVTTQVLVNGSPAPLYAVSYGQINFQMPVETPPGTALVQVVRDGLPSNTVSVAVAARAPRLLLITTTGYGAIQNGADNPATLAMPVSYSVPGVATLQAHPAHAGDTIILYGIGLGATSPAVGTGAPAPGTPPFAQLTSQVQVIFGDSFFGAKAAPLFAGLAPGFAGLYQVNVKIPADFAGKGAVLVSLLFGDGTFSNPVNVEIQ